MRTMPLVVGLVVGAIAFGCDRSPTAPPTASPAPSFRAAQASLPSQRAGGSTSTGLISCSQSYDSVTRVIGPKGGYFAVGPHYLFVDSLALSDTVSITAVAPAGTVRWVRFRPDGLVFQTTVDGWSALLYTNYKDCGVPTGDTVRIAQVTDSLSILGYLQTYVKVRRNPWSQGAQYVAGLLQHFSNYAVAW
jgi:hypothetical protein